MCSATARPRSRPASAATSDCRSTRRPNTYSPAHSVIATATRSWDDANGNFFPDCDLTNAGRNGECGPLDPGTFGTLQVRQHARSGLDQRVRQARLQLAGVAQHRSSARPGCGVERRLLPHLVRQLHRHRQPAGHAGRLRSVLRHRAGRCAAAGGSERQQICGLYDIKPSQFGQVNNVVGPRLQLRQADRGLQRLRRQLRRLPRQDGQRRRRLEHRQLVRGRQRRRQSPSPRPNTCFVVDSPQQLFNCETGNPYQSRIKFNGSVALPLGPAARLRLSEPAGSAVHRPDDVHRTRRSRRRSGASCRHHRQRDIDLLPAGSAYLRRSDQPAGSCGSARS